jgi:predicted HNH restriction endonuclease
MPVVDGRLRGHDEKGDSGMEGWRPMEFADVPSIDEFKELTREFLRGGITNCEVMRNQVRIAKKMMIQKSSGNWNATPSGKFINNHAQALARMVISEEIATTDEKEYRFVGSNRVAPAAANANAPVRHERVYKNKPDLLTERIESDFHLIAPDRISRVILSQVVKDLESALEGMPEERKVKFRYRAAWLAQQFVEMRRLDHALKCDRCAFDPSVLHELGHLKPRSLFDVHHKDPLAEGLRYTTLDDFLLLCPTCHRIEHALLAAKRKATVS